MEKKILTIIPARGGSKTIPHKNIKNLCGKPLIAWTINNALECEYLDRIVVSTDDLQISKISKEFGAEVPFLRPNKIAEDDSPTIDAIIHSLDFLENNGYHPEIVVLLQPTSPLRTAQDIESALNLFFEYEKTCSAVVSVSEFDHSPYLSLKIEKGYLKPNFGEEYFNKRRQDLPQLYKPNGSIYISTPNNIRKFGGFFGNKIVPYKMPQERSVDIDTITDFKLAELMLGELNEIY
ncbi:MAG TPA: acylneuraminate cytidylyltransferase family protein [Methanothermobacter sp.]|nr:acylneuraminate cytidylyltransferase family protein [Methanothermobacter sp.]